jgi:hypothetical protein
MNDMRFGITGLGRGAALTEISHEEFTRAKLAKRRIVRSLVIEDKFDLVLANYTDFERELLGLAVHQMIYSDLSWSSAQLDRQVLNRRIVNLLSAGRLYIDHVMHDASILAGEDKSLVERLKRKSSQQYDAKLGYRVMDSLRNYTQHRSLPVHELGYPSSLVPPDERGNLVYRVVPRIALQALREDDRVKRSVIAELEAIGPDVPLTPLIREYAEGLSVIHGEFRKLTDDDIPSWEATFNWVWDRANNAFGAGRDSVQIVAINDRGEYTDAEQIFEDLINHRKDLAKKNQVLTNLARRFVSGACDLRET